MKTWCARLMAGGSADLNGTMFRHIAMLCEKTQCGDNLKDVNYKCLTKHLNPRHISGTKTTKVGKEADRR